MSDWLSCRHGITFQQVCKPCYDAALARAAAQPAASDATPAASEQADADETPTPIGVCPKCSTPYYATQGFCGVCHPEKL